MPPPPRHFDFRWALSSLTEVDSLRQLYRTDPAHVLYISLKKNYIFSGSFIKPAIQEIRRPDYSETPG